MDRRHRFKDKWSDGQLSFFLATVRQNKEINGREMKAQLELAFENPDYTSPTTLYEEIKLARIFIKKMQVDPDELDNTEQWRLEDEEDEEDARLILSALPDVLKELGGQKTSFTKREAWWVAKIKRTAPSIDGWKSYLFAREFIGRGDGDTTDLYLLLDVYDGDFLKKSGKLMEMFEAKLVPQPQGVTDLQLFWRMEHLNAMADAIEFTSEEKAELQDITGDIESAMTRTIREKILDTKPIDGDASDNVPAHDIP